MQPYLAIAVIIVIAVALLAGGWYLRQRVQRRRRDRRAIARQTQLDAWHNRVGAPGKDLADGPSAP